MIYNEIIYLNYKISIYNKNFIKNLIKIKSLYIKKINSSLIKYYFSLQKNHLKKKVVIKVKNRISFKTNILITYQKYIDLFLKKKIIFNELDGTILIDFLYAKQINYKIKKKIKNL
ncbi:MAG: hypothetical protein V9V01_00745 [Candidatus Shikimatogenerans sp. Tmey]